MHSVLEKYMQYCPSHIRQPLSISILSINSIDIIMVTIYTLYLSLSILTAIIVGTMYLVYLYWKKTNSNMKTYRIIAIAVAGFMALVYCLIAYVLISP
jgi:hypothetical protein